MHPEISPDSSFKGTGSARVRERQHKAPALAGGDVLLVKLDLVHLQHFDEFISEGKLLVGRSWLAM